MPDSPTQPTQAADAAPRLQRELEEALAIAKLDMNIGRGAMVQITATAIDCGEDKEKKPLTLFVIERVVGKIDRDHSERWGITSLRDMGRGTTWADALRNAKPAAHDYGKGRRGGG